MAQEQSDWEPVAEIVYQPEGAALSEFRRPQSWRRRGPQYLENVESVSARRAEKVSTRPT